MEKHLIFKIIRIIALVLTGICLVYSIERLVRDFQNKAYTDNVQTFVSDSVIAIALILGASGAWYKKLEQLITAAIILVVAIIVGFTDRSDFRAFNLPSVSVALVIMYSVMAFLMRRGYH